MGLKAEIAGVTVESQDAGESIENELLRSAYNIGARRFETQYYPSGWHRMAAIVSFLGGKMVTPEPKVEENPGMVY